MRITRDLLAGLLIFALGLMIAIYTYTHYRMGTIQSMGPGYVPFALSIILAVLGFISAAFSRSDGDKDDRQFNLRKVIPVVIAVLAFASTITSLGLIVSTVLLVFISSFADTRFNFKLTFYLTLSLCSIALIVFSYFLKMTMPIFW